MTTPIHNPFPPESPLHAVAEALLSRPVPPVVVPMQDRFDAALTPIIDHSDAPPMTRAALHLLNDDLDTAHRIAQAAEGDPMADYLHGLIHRREGDRFNAGYWMRRVPGKPNREADPPGDAENWREISQTLLDCVAQKV